VPVWFFDPERRQGIHTELAGDPGADPEVRLAPCGAARLRFVDRGGRPLGRLPVSAFSAFLVLRPGAEVNEARENHTVAEILVPTSYFNIRHPPVAPAEGGALLFPDLIPGATYRILTDSNTPWSARATFTATWEGGVQDLDVLAVERPPRKRN
jgi:hypothetical protein